ncbi:tetratricopeptide repeat-containing diguanylate cyclase [Psychrosphaera algicola]|uniref:diguanylate cyclase n=1 Tax=Psychrosphaera algicola TaxID=3023714 RepID=A0ABT5FDX4_9GAMM|nr:tetratricopeptide repeat-containing diguanylate cyclase [Psychrosphaera sp. G1-22]MDC2889722.1 diguanylate cyclase [Psychrosphaera sp. G1-22]
MKLANEALRLSTINNNHTVSAEAHSLLGQLNQRSHNADQSLDNFLQASVIYNNINDKRNQILSTIDYIEVLLVEKRYDQAENTIDELLPITLQYDDGFLIALTFINKGNGYYQQKRYQDAINQYLQAPDYLYGSDKVIQHRLGETYKIIGQSYKRLRNREQAAKYYRKTLEVFTTLQDKRLMARTLNTLADSERYLGNLVIALDYSMQGLELHQGFDDPEAYAKSLLGAGIIYRLIGRYEKSLTHIHEAYLYYKQVNDVLGIAKTSNQIGHIYTRLKQFEQAKSFYQVTVDLPEGSIEEKTIASSLRELAVINLKSGDYKTAMVMAHRAYTIYKRSKYKSNQSVIARIIANIYRAINDTNNAINYYRESLSLAREINSKIYQIRALNPLAGILIGIDNDEAISLLNESLALSKELNNKVEMLFAYGHFRTAEKDRGNFTAALHYAEQELELSEIIQKENEDNQLILAKANLHSHKLEVELEALKEKSKLDELELARKNNEIEIAKQVKTITELELIKNKYASVALTLLLVICLSLIFLIYRRFIASNKRNKELDYLAARDPLTDCYNRRILLKLMNQNFENAEILGEYCIILADIDHFKKVNDTFGHNIGDSVLKSFAHVLQNCVRQNDIVARFGGEEFCIVLHRVTPEQAMTIAENMRKKWNKQLLMMFR